MKPLLVGRTGGQVRYSSSPYHSADSSAWQVWSSLLR